MFRKYFRCILLVLGTVAVGVFACMITWMADSVMTAVFLAYLLETVLAISIGLGAEEIQKAFLGCLLFSFLSLTFFLLALGMNTGFGSAPERKVILIILLFALTLLFSYMVIAVSYARKEAYEELLKKKDEIPVALADADD